MRLVALAVAGVVTLGAGSASAQYAPYRPYGAIPIHEIRNAIDAMGFDPVGPAVASGHLVIQRAVDDRGRLVRVTFDTRVARVVSVVPAREGAPVYRGGPYAGDGPYWRRPYGPYAAMPRFDDDDDIGYAPAPRPAPPPYAAAPRPDLKDVPPGTPAPRAATPKENPKAATVTPSTRPPVPRKRPESAPQAAAGTVTPLPPQNSAPAAATPPAAPASPQIKPGTPPLPPYAPLE